MSVSMETFIANWISGKRSAHCGAAARLERMRNSRVSVLCCISHSPLACGCPGVVRICLISAVLQSVETTPINSFPRSESINSGTPCSANHLWHNANMTSAAYFERSGINCTHRVQRSTTVSTYRYPDGSRTPGLYRSIAIALNGSGANDGVSDTWSVARNSFARLHASQAVTYR